MLFCPADRPERFEKAAQRADVVILDLEDAVSPAAKSAARSALIASSLDPERVVVRINRASSDQHALDLAAVAQTDYRVVMQAKSESPESIAAHGLSTVALIETPLGAVRAEQVIAAPNCIGAMWGAEDLVAGLGGRSSRFGPGEPGAGRYRDVAVLTRARIRLASAAFGKFAVDAVHVDIDDVEGLDREVRDAVALGYAATACIHPSQVPIIRAGYAPTDDEVTRARRVIAAADAADNAVFALDGVMIDEPVVAQARAVLARTRTA